MPRYQILPLNKLVQSFHAVAPDPSGVLALMHRLGFYDADVHCEGVYSFSANSFKNGAWCIFTRNPKIETATTIIG